MGLALLSVLSCPCWAVWRPQALGWARTELLPCCWGSERPLHWPGTQATADRLLCRMGRPLLGGTSLWLRGCPRSPCSSVPRGFPTCRALGVCLGALAQPGLGWSLYGSSCPWATGRTVTSLQRARSEGRGVAGWSQQGRECWALRLAAQVSLGLLPVQKSMSGRRRTDSQPMVEEGLEGPC